jgi:flagellar basal body-associated protein FliL
MADEDDIKEQEEQESPEELENQEDREEQEEQKDSKAEKSGKKSLIARFVPWIIMLVVVAICAGAGLFAGRLFAGSRRPQAEEPGPDSEASTQAEDLKADTDSSKQSGKFWYYELDPVVANLNEPTVTRYVRASLMLEMSVEMDEKKGTAFLDEKKPILVNWLTVYLSSLSLEDVRGDKNLRSIQSQIRDAFNEELFPDSKPQIKQVLIKEFPVQ